MIHNPIKQRQQIVLLSTLRNATKQRQQVVLPIRLHNPTKQRQEIVLLIMRRTHSIKTKATSRTSYHAPHPRKQRNSVVLSCYARQSNKNKGNKSYFLIMPRNPTKQGQQITLFVNDAAQPNETKATNRASCCGFEQNSGKKSYFLVRSTTQQNKINKSYFPLCSTTCQNKGNKTNFLLCSTIPQNQGNKSYFLFGSTTQQNKRSKSYSLL